ncbi:hypothetical protein MSPP1_002032 [Malassezia sp. CBS 17886]|nr:hypothetical protein MSPP1_002032 [Malassezia sp. CBS 17886]
MRDTPRAASMQRDQSHNRAEDDSAGVPARSPRGARPGPMRREPSTNVSGNRHPPRDMSPVPNRRCSTATPSRSTERHAEDRSEGVDVAERKGDEYKTRDRGEALIRRRMRERKREKLLKQRRDMERQFAAVTPESGGAARPDSAYYGSSLAGERHGSGVPPRPGDSYAPDPLSSPGSPTHYDPPSSASWETRRDRASYVSDSFADTDAARTQAGSGASGARWDSEHGEEGDDGGDCGDYDDDGGDDSDDLEYTLKDRQDALNIEHPFGLPIWKPALYKKVRSITKSADSALKCAPGQNYGRGTLPGNIAWAVLFGVWLSALCFALYSILRFIPHGGQMYARVLYGLGMYIVWPFGHYVELEVSHPSGDRHGACRLDYIHERDVQDSGSDRTPFAMHADDNTLEGEGTPADGAHAVPRESSPLRGDDRGAAPSYGAVDATADARALTEEERLAAETGVYHYVYDDAGRDIGAAKRWAGIVAYAVLYGLVLFPALGLVCLVCWGLVVTIPMAKMMWMLLKNLALQPLALHFRSPWQIDTAVMKVHMAGDYEDQTPLEALLRPGQAAPRLKPKHRKKGTSKRRSMILLCTYRAGGMQYFKYTIGGVNILFVNTVPVTFFTIFLFFVVRPYLHAHGVTGGLLGLLVSDGTVFFLALASVLPLSYFIGMAVASISTQSSIGMGAVINATFGSVIELILYSIALADGRAGLVEGSLIGSILAGVLLLPGMSMCSSAMRRKEQKFNAQSAGVTSTMLIMAIIGILTPTMFYQIYGTFELSCEGCPDAVLPSEAKWRCDRCSYQHVSPIHDKFFETNVKGLVVTCASILIMSYCIGLWFSLRTHASQIWNIAQHTHVSTQPDHFPPPLHRASVYKRMFPPNYLQHFLPQHHERATAGGGGLGGREGQVGRAGREGEREGVGEGGGTEHGHEDFPRRTDTAHAAGGQQPAQAPSGGQSPHATPSLVQPSQAASAEHTFHPRGGSDRREGRTPSEHTMRSETHAKVSLDDIMQDAAMRMYQYLFNQHKSRQAQDADEDENGEHDAPSWSRIVSLSVLLSCTVLYAVIAEILVDVVDVVVNGYGVSEKFIGVTLFALVPNTTEFMNAMSFAVNGNIALSLEIGSAYVLQVCLIQIPAMVGFSMLYAATHPPAPGNILEDHTFMLIFPRWDIIAILLSIFLLTYTYIEARSNYHRGSILILAYLVLVSGFFFAPKHDPDEFQPEASGTRSWLV